MQFVYEALRPDGSTIAARLEAGDRREAVESLREQGLLVLRLDERGRAPAAAGPRRAGARLRSRDLILFTRQMKMLLEAGAALVPALDAAAEQSARPAVRSLILRLRERVEKGASLSEALEGEPRRFDPVFRTMVAAGEATAALPQIFGRLSALAQQQQQTRKLLLGALLYPAVLSVMLAGVVGLLLGFVVPRFAALFASLRSPLPATTLALFAASGWLRDGWPYLLAGAAAAVAGLVAAVRLPATRTWLDDLALRLPLAGPLAKRLILGRVLRVWAAMLRCHVPLLEVIRKSREAVTNARFLALIADVEEAVASGGRMGRALGQTRLVDPVIVAAIATGEENGRLAEAVDFVSGWLDEDNAAVVHHVARLAEPVLLALMGLIVGFVAMSLFIPLFDLATAAG